MKARPFILRSFACLLLLVFLQKSGAGLFVHNLWHNTPARSQTPLTQNEKSTDISYACSCIDDFLMPFTEPDAVRVAPAFITYNISPSVYLEECPIRPIEFTTLRGPPVFA